MARNRADSTDFDTGAWGGAAPEEPEETEIDPSTIVKKESIVK